jgi:AcrR family transcriptional regulator
MSQKALRNLPAGDVDADDVAAQIAQQTLRKREAQYATEVRRLLDAALDVMREGGTGSSPRVADIVAAAGLSNDAFYRHFASKEALVAALLEDGSARLRGYLEHQMAKERTAEGKVRRWVEGVLSQAADDDVATTTRAVMWNGVARHPSPAAALAMLLREPFAQLGSSDPDADAALASHATIGMLSDFLWQRLRPTRAHVDHVARFVLASLDRDDRAPSTR